MNCENCGRQNEPGANFCAGCGVELRQEPGDASALDSGDAACPNCGAVNAAGAAYCGACGVELAAVPAASSGGGTIPTRDLGALLGESLRVYRANFLPFIAIIVLPQVANVLFSNISSQTSISFQMESAPTVLHGFLLLLLFLATIVLSAVAVGAVAFGVARHYTRGSVDVMDCLSHAFQVVVLLIAQGIVVTVVAASLLIVGVSFFIVGTILLISGNEAQSAIFLAFGLLVMIPGLVVAAWIGVRWFCGAQAVVIEGKGPVAGLGRSWNLVRGSWWRVFGTVAIIVIAAWIFGGILPGVMTGLAAPSDGGVLTLGSTIAGALVTIIIAPFTYIVPTLLYFDLRVRKEGLDLDTLAAETSRV